MMPVNYTVLSSVVDIRADVPDSNDVFLVDSNVWYWQTYNRASQGNHAYYQVREYPKYLKAMVDVGSKIYSCPLTLVELSNLIERTERQIIAKIGGMEDLDPKEFRHNNPAARQAVVAEIENAWGQVTLFADSLDAFADDEAAEKMLKRLRTNGLDGTDYLLVDAMEHAKVTNIISDDGDFCTIGGLCLYTANQTVLATAKAQGKLISRPVVR